MSIRHARQSQPRITPKLRTMMLATQEAGSVIKSHFRRTPEELGLEVKADNTVLTITDGQSQDTMVSFVSKSFPTTRSGRVGVSFLAEEKRQVPRNPRHKNWCVGDPVDGTKNFSTGNVAHAVALAWAQKQMDNRLVVRNAVTLQPLLDWQVISTDKGTFSRKVMYKATWKSHVLDKMASTGVVALWGDIKDPEDGRVIAAILAGLGRMGYEARMIGSSALMNAGVATGMYDGAIIYSGQKIYAHPWDIASSHQIEKAGGVVTTIKGIPDPLNNDPHSLIGARDAEVHDKLLTVVKSARRECKALPIVARPLWHFDAAFKPRP